jgi:hypothetical protein
VAAQLAASQEGLSSVIKNYVVLFPDTHFSFIIIIIIIISPAVEAGYHTSVLELRVVEGDGKGTRCLGI